MSEFINLLNKLLNYRNFAQIREEVANLNPQNWAEEITSPEGKRILKLALKNSDLEALSAIFFNPYENAVAGTEAYRLKEQRQLIIDEELKNLIPKASLDNMFLGRIRIPEEAKTISEMMIWNEKLLSLSNPEALQEEILALEGLSEKEKDIRMEGLARILIGLRNRNQDIEVDHWDAVFIDMPAILAENPWRKSSLPDDLWRGVFMEMVMQGRHADVESMLLSLNEDIRRDFIEQGGCSWALEEAENQELEEVTEAIEMVCEELEIDLEVLYSYLSDDDQIRGDSFIFPVGGLQPFLTEHQIDIEEISNSEESDNEEEKVETSYNSPSSSPETKSNKRFSGNNDRENQGGGIV